ncbi:hypothetical protein ABIA39_008361 [Nocardia sp. GAS34]|uniref:hypothetical protein n=1 Tax=unclassified Nocardia TaxID=2637762 RepID=UPI003D1D6ED6
MARKREEADLIAEGFERVYIESERYDGPRAGVADVEGKPHYFEGRDFDWADEMDAYYVWPAGEAAVAWELEQWAIYVRWDQRYRAGEAAVDSHPGHGGIDPRYDELTTLLTPYRQAPDNARKLLAELQYDSGDFYRIGGTGMWFRWHPVEDVNAEK